MSRVGFVTHYDCSRHDTGWRHPEHQGRLPAVSRAVYRDMLTLHEHLVEVEGVPASFETLLLAHDAAYLERIREAVQVSARDTGHEVRGGPESAASYPEPRLSEHQDQPIPFENGTMLSGASWDALTAAAGCAVTAVDGVLAEEYDSAHCVVRPPGSGASRDAAGHDAIVNHVAVAARHLRERAGLQRVLVLEWGERPGHGTAQILSADEGCEYICIHAAPAVLESGATASFPIRAGGGGDELRAALGAALQKAAVFQPEFVLLSTGFDILASDPSGSLAAVPEDIHPMTEMVVDFARSTCGGRLVTVLEGGYDPPGMGLGVVQHLRALAGIEG